MGPHYANFRAIAEDLRAHHAIRIAEKEELALALVGLLSNPTEAKAMGERARQVFEQQAGATARCVEAIRGLLSLSAMAPTAVGSAASERRA
jgi:3-deoxy-D-manno-octulosonic-acid transferase